MRWPRLAMKTCDNGNAIAVVTNGMHRRLGTQSPFPLESVIQTQYQILYGSKLLDTPLPGSGYAAVLVRNLEEERKLHSKAVLLAAHRYHTLLRERERIHAVFADLRDMLRRAEETMAQLALDAERIHHVAQSRAHVPIAPYYDWHVMIVEYAHESLRELRRDNDKGAREYVETALDFSREVTSILELSPQYVTTEMKEVPL